MASLGLRARGEGEQDKKEWAAYWEEDADEDMEGTETEAQSLWEAEVAAIWVEGRSFEGGDGGDI